MSTSPITMKHFFLATVLVLTACAQTSGPYVDPQGWFTATPPEGWEPVRSESIVYKDATMKGVAFKAPQSVGEGTVLDEARIDIATGPMSACPNIGEPAKLDQENARRWEWTDPGAGNMYQATVVSAGHGDTCYRITLFTHGCNLGADCAPGRTDPFDHRSLLPELNTLVASFRFAK